MAVPPFPPDALKMPDDELGGLLLGYFIAVQADDAGIPIDQIPDEFAERVRQHVLTAESRTARNAAVALALHKAASGDFATAGKLLREHMSSGAADMAIGMVALKFAPAGIRRLRQAAEFGGKGAKTNKDKGALNRRAVLDAATEILAGRQSKRPPGRNELAGVISAKIGMPLDTVKGHLTALKKAKMLVLPDEKKLG